MHKINLTGILHISSELMSRLQKRGLLSSSGNCTEDFVLYIQECLARDDMRYPWQPEPYLRVAEIESQKSEPLLRSEVIAEDNAVPQESVSVKKGSSNSISSLIDESDLADLKHNMATLYRGGAK